MLETYTRETIAITNKIQCNKRQTKYENGKKRDRHRMQWQQARMHAYKIHIQNHRNGWKETTKLWIWMQVQLQKRFEFGWMAIETGDRIMKINKRKSHASNELLNNDIFIAIWIVAHVVSSARKAATRNKRRTEKR